MLWLVAAADLAGHDIPSDLTVQAFVKPDGERLRLLVRVPLKAIRDLVTETGRLSLRSR